MALREGTSASVVVTVDETMTAAAFGKGAEERYPAVVATPVMLGEMERAAAALVRPLLGEDELSVGARVEIAHLAPTPVGAPLKTHARFTGREGALFWFDVWSEDRGGVVGKGRHARVIVDADKIEDKAATRNR